MPASPTAVRKFLLISFLSLCNCASHAQSTYYVSTTGNDTNPGTEALPWRTIQHGCRVALPGSTVLIKAGIYGEKVDVEVSGDIINGFITIKNFEQDSVILDGTGIPGQNMIYIENKNYLRMSGLILRDNTGVADGSGIRIEGYADHIELSGNVIHNMRGSNAMGITCYGTNATLPIGNLAIKNNRIFDCDAAPSEALTLNGNVDGFEILDNTVHDINNIGIDMIGGEGMCPNGPKDRARNGLCRGNTVFRCRSSYGGGYAAGIYVDGGRVIVVEGNRMFENDVGLEVGCENHNEVADSIVVRNNLIYNNDKRGLSFGGYNFPSTGQVRYCQFLNNTVFHNDILSTGDGECHIEYARNCVVRNNIFFSSTQDLLLTSIVGSSNGNILNDNLWFSPDGSASALFMWNSIMHTGFAAYRVATTQDSSSLFSDPSFANSSLPAPDLHITPASPARDAGSNSFAGGGVDFDGDPRIIGMNVDIGADEVAELAIAPVLSSPADASTGHAPIVELTWFPTAGASEYRVQMAMDSTFTSLASDDTTAIITINAGPFDGNSELYWRVAGLNAVGQGPWSGHWRFFTSGYQTSTHAMQSGWNLLSVPLTLFDERAGSVLPTAVSQAFGFGGSSGYVQADSLHNGIGYWVKFGVDQNVAFYGESLTRDTIPVNPGWNMIGSITFPIGVTDVVQLPNGILQSDFFSYNGFYASSDSLRPAMGYWVKSGSNGFLILDSGVVNRKKK